MDISKEILVKILNDYFDINNDTYCYNLTRDKEAFSVGTMSLGDFEEFTEETTDDLAGYIIGNFDRKLVTDGWIPAEKRLPKYECDGDEEPVVMLVTVKGIKEPRLGFYCDRDKSWYVRGNHDDEENYNPERDVIAWQPLPDPYKGV